MPKAILEYDLPEETDQYMDAMNGATYRIILDELDNKLRAMVKYEDLKAIKIDDVRQLIRDLKSDYGPGL